MNENFCGNSSVGRAQPCQGWGREFESRFPLNITNFSFSTCSRGGMVDALVSGASVERHAGSIPVVSTITKSFLKGEGRIEKIDFVVCRRGGGMVDALL